MDVEYVCGAIEWVCKYGWYMMMTYRCEYLTGEWRYTSRQGQPFGKNMRQWLSLFSPFGEVEAIQCCVPSLEKTHAQATNMILKQIL